MCNQDEVENCIFCKIISGQVPSSKVYEDETVYAFNDIEPKTKVHILIVPKKHYANIAQVAEDDSKLLAHMISVSQQIANEKYNGDYRLIFNTGKQAGQTVFHAHGHILTGEDMTALPMASNF